MSIPSFLIQPTHGFVPVGVAGSLDTAPAAVQATQAAHAAFGAPWEAPASIGVRLAEGLIFASACVYFALGASIFGLF